MSSISICTANNLYKLPVPQTCPSYSDLINDEKEKRSTLHTLIFPRKRKRRRDAAPGQNFRMKKEEKKIFSHTARSISQSLQSFSCGCFTFLMVATNTVSAGGRCSTSLAPGVHRAYDRVGVRCKEPQPGVTTLPLVASFVNIRRFDKVYFNTKITIMNLLWKILRESVELI